MKVSRLSALVVLAGTAVTCAQPTLDGLLAGDQSYYGAPKYVQTQPTSFCNNTNVGCGSVGLGVRVAVNNSNIAGVTGGTAQLDALGQAAAAAVSTGVEVAIPLAQLGTLGSTIRVAGWVNGGGSNYVSNQVIGGFTTPTQGNLGGDGLGGFNGTAAINWTTFAGNQFMSVAVPGSIPSATVVMDGTRDASYPAPQFIQTHQTQFGDGMAGGIDCPGGGSEIDSVSAMIVNADLGAGAQNYLVLFIAGNLECNFNRLNLMIDNGSGAGFNVVPNTCLAAADGLGVHGNMQFDLPFRATHYMSMRNGGGPFGIFADFAEVRPSGFGGFIGGAGSGAPGITGAASSCPPSATVSIGSELDAVYARVNKATGRLNLMITGNLKERDFLHLFFDVGPGGQNSIRADNVVIGEADGNNGHLGRFGPSGAGNPALTFDAGFEADYFLTAHFENGNRQALDAAVLRTNGKDLIPNTSASNDFGSFQGKDSGNEINFDGTNFTNFTNPPAGIQLQDGFATNVYSAFPPRETRRIHDAFITARGGYSPAPDNTEWTTYVTTTNPPVAGLIRARFDNSNLLGVSDTSGAGGATATAGLEYSISLAELGYSGCGPIRLAGFIANNNTTVVSNQVIGGSGSLTNLGDPRNINLGTIAGNQFVVVLCPQDFNGDGAVSVQDIFDFLAAWFSNSPSANFNCVGGIGVQDIFDFLAAWFAGNC